jgi:hypothetical protein
MGVLLFCNVDADGVITESLFGARVIPMQQYDYFFYIADKDEAMVAEELPKYRVVDRQLVLSES